MKHQLFSGHGEKMNKPQDWRPTCPNCGCHEIGSLPLSLEENEYITVICENCKTKYKLNIWEINSPEKWMQELHDAAKQNKLKLRPYLFSEDIKPHKPKKHQHGDWIHTSILDEIHATLKDIKALLEDFLKHYHHYEGNK